MTDQNANQPKNDRAARDQVALVSFIDDLIKERKDPNIKPENLAQVKELLLKEVNDAINRHLVSLLADKDKLELDTLLDKNPTTEDLDQFFSSKITNLEAEIASALLSFRSAYLFPVTQTKSSNKLETPPPAPAPKVN